MKNLIQIILLNTFLVIGVYAQECIGNDYEQDTLLPQTIIDNVSIAGYKNILKSEEVMTLTQNVSTITGYDDSSVFYYVCTDIGELRMIETSTNYKSIEYIAPYVSSNQEAKIEFLIGDGYGYVSYTTLTVQIEKIEDYAVSLQSNYTTFINQALTLTASTLNISNESEATYSWNFGDGGTGNGKSSEHTYNTEGNYTAEVTVSYGGVTKKATTQVEVKTPIVSVEKDITNWKQTLAGRYNDMHFENGRFVAVGAVGNIATSTDGINWQVANYVNQDNIGDLMAVTYGNGKWVVVGGISNSKGVTVTSTDGINWSVVNSYTTAKITDVHFANNLFVKVGQKSIKSYSSDGVSWSGGYFGTIINGASADFSSVTYDSIHGKWIAVGTASGDLIYTSSDAKRWDENSFKPSGISINRVDSYNGKTIAVAYKSSSPRGGVVLSSNDGGATWSSQTVVNNNPIVALNHTSLGWFASVGNGDIVSSLDGVSWKVEKTNRSQWCTSFAYANSKLLATGHSYNIYEAQVKDARREFSIALSVHEGGRVTYDGGSCRSGESCSPILANEGDTITFSTTPDSGYLFKYWLSDCLGDGECSLNITDNKRVEAYFAKVETLTISKPSDGYVSSSDEKIKCGESFNDCSVNYVEGNSVQLLYHDSANSSNRFKSWNGDINSTSSITTIVMNSNKNIGVTFKANVAPTITMLQELNVSKNQSAYIDFVINDEDGDVVESSIVGNPSVGTLNLVGNRVIYTPNQNYVGNDGFVLLFNDGHGGVVSKGVSVKVSAENSVPTISTDSNLTIFKNSPKIIRFDINDSDALDVVAVTVDISPTHGTIEYYSSTLKYIEYKYTPTLNYIGDDSLRVKADDKHGGVVYLPIILHVIESPIIDSDNDGITDETEIALGLNPNSNDSDGDGILDSEEIGDVNSPLDTDNDGTINALDTDSDDDGVSDSVEREQGTNYLDDADKPQTIGITLDKTSYKLGLGLRDLDVLFSVSNLQDGTLFIKFLNENQDIVTTSQAIYEWTSGDVALKLKAVGEGNATISIEVKDALGNIKIQDVNVSVIKIADFVDEQVTPGHLEDVNQSCIDIGARLPTATEINDAFMIVDNYLTTVDSLWTSTPHLTQSGHLKFKGRDATYPWVNAAFDTASTLCVKENTQVISTQKIVLNPGYNLVHISGTIEALVSKVGFPNLISVQGGGQGTAYKKSNVENNKAFLNTFKQTKDGDAYWVNVANRVEIEIPKVAYRGRKVISLKAGWNLIDPYESLTIAQIVEQLTFNRLEVIQGAKQGTSYKKTNVESGKTYLNTLEKFDVIDGYWIKVTEDCELSFLFDLDIEAKDIASNPISIVESINGVEYTVKLFTDSQPQTETSQSSISVYGNIDGQQVIIEINDSYLSTSKFQVAVYDNNGNEVGRSDVVDFASESIDWGSFLIVS